MDLDERTLPYHPVAACMPPCHPPTLVHGFDDYFLWRTSEDTPPGHFSAATTWKALHPTPAVVSWHQSIWFKFGIPKHAFHAWVSVCGRLPTRDRLLRWGMSVPPSCLLCGTADESRDHIYFSCSFSRSVWDFFSLLKGISISHILLMRLSDGFITLHLLVS